MCLKVSPHPATWCAEGRAGGFSDRVPVSDLMTGSGNSGLSRDLGERENYCLVGTFDKNFTWSLSSNHSTDQGAAEQGSWIAIRKEFSVHWQSLKVVGADCDKITDLKIIIKFGQPLTAYFVSSPHIAAPPSSPLSYIPFLIACDLIANDDDAYDCDDDKPNSEEEDFVGATETETRHQIFLLSRIHSPRPF